MVFVVGEDDSGNSSHANKSSNPEIPFKDKGKGYSPL